jgi:glycylpeptide N-tetradecanoyltransferase
MACISGVPTTVQVNDHELDIVEINFLCVHKKLRSKRLSPVLIKEITRRVNLTGIFQAVYTSGTILPVPVSSARYYHRTLNPKKLVDVGFTRCPPRMTMARFLKIYKLPDSTTTKGLRPMVDADVSNVHKLLNKYLSRFSLKVLFTEEEIRHWLLPRENVVQSYVVQNDEGIITDFASFYHLKSNVLNVAEKLNAAYSFYNVALTVPLVDLMKDALILAKESGCDVFNALELMENKSFFEPLKFGPGDGTLHYYIYNWSCPEMTADKVGIVLL